MATYEDTRFSGKTIELDGNAFRRCSFENCSLKFVGTAPTELRGCTFSRCRLVAEGAAELTVAYLRGFYQGLGEWGQGAVETLFDSIRGPEPTVRRTILEAFGASAEGKKIVGAFARLSAAKRMQIASLICQAAGDLDRVTDRPTAVRR